MDRHDDRNMMATGERAPHAHNPPQQDDRGMMDKGKDAMKGAAHKTEEAAQHTKAAVQHKTAQGHEKVAHAGQALHEKATGHKEEHHTKAKRIENERDD